ncbi:Uncharacterized protein NEOC95_001347 [Neochlamydia sp. AcF95]|nr:Uncharacterized protein [Neochlamydia sp. AcF95]
MKEIMVTIPGKIPLRIYPFFWILTLIIGWLNSFSEITSIHAVLIKTVLWVIVITFSIIVHEYGHALSALAFGQRSTIELTGLGGATYRTGPKLKLWQEFIIVLAGPLAGFALAGGTYLFLNRWSEHSSHLGIFALEICFYVNTFWTIVNLLPVQPLDGGRLLSIILEGLLGLRGIKIASFISILIAAGVGLFFFAVQAILAGSLFLILAFESYRSWQSTLSMQAQDQNDEIKDLLKAAEEDLQEGRKQEAFEKFKTVRNRTQSGVLYRQATYHEALLLNEKGDYKAAYEILYPLKNKFHLPIWQLLQDLAYHNQDWKEAIQLGNRIFSEAPSYQTALTNALSYAQLGLSKPAVGWLESAFRQGMPYKTPILSKSEFDSIRPSSAFQNLLKNCLNELN